MDGMAFLHTLKQMPDTFRELAEKVLALLLKQADIFDQISRVDFVCDRYEGVSIKNAERIQRCLKGVVQVRISKPSQKCPKQWQKFLADDLNKREFIRFLHAEWQSIGYATEGRNFS